MKRQRERATSMTTNSVRDIWEQSHAKNVNVRAKKINKSLKLKELKRGEKNCFFFLLFRIKWLTQRGAEISRTRWLIDPIKNTYNSHRSFSLSHNDNLFFMFISLTYTT